MVWVWLVVAVEGGAERREGNGWELVTLGVNVTCVSPFFF